MSYVSLKNQTIIIFLYLLRPYKLWQGLALYGKGNGEDSNIIQTLKMRAKYDTLFLIGLMKEKRNKFSS